MQVRSCSSRIGSPSPGSVVWSLVLTAVVLTGGAVRSASALTLDIVDRGRYAPSGSHDPTNLDYTAGDCRGPVCAVGADDLRNFFVFDLSTVTGPIIAATLKLWNPPLEFPLRPGHGFKSDQTSETYVVFDVTTPIADLVAGSPGAAAWGDLGGGTVYGSHVATQLDIGLFAEISLNSAALVAMNSSSGLFAFGGAITTLNDVPDEEHLFAFTEFVGTPGVSILDLTVGPDTVPEPGVPLLLAASLLGLALCRRLVPARGRSRRGVSRAGIGVGSR